MDISTNQKPTIYRNLYENTAPGIQMNQKELTKTFMISNGNDPLVSMILQKLSALQGLNTRSTVEVTSLTIGKLSNDF